MLRPARRAHSTTRGTRAGSWVRSRTFSTWGTADCIPKETRVKPPSARAARPASSTESGLASVVTSASAASPKHSRTRSSMLTRSAAGSMVGVPPPTKTVCAARTGRPASSMARRAARSSPARVPTKSSAEAPCPMARFV